MGQLDGMVRRRDGAAVWPVGDGPDAPSSPSIPCSANIFIYLKAKFSVQPASRSFSARTGSATESILLPLSPPTVGIIVRLRAANREHLNGLVYQQRTACIDETIINHLSCSFSLFWLRPPELWGPLTLARRSTRHLCRPLLASSLL